MRADAIGLFWEDKPSSRKRSDYVRAMPPIPETGWEAPDVFPDLSSCPVLSVDVETYDPELKEKGPGWARGVGHIVGVSVGASGGGRWYFPIRHEVSPEQNLNPDTVLSWLKDQLGNPHQTKVGANLYYDVGWLRQEGVEVRGPLVDVQYAEALLSEAGQTALDYLGQKYLGEGKVTNTLYQWCSDFYGGSLSVQRKNIYRSPPSLVGPYAESDADLPLRLAPKLYPLLQAEGLLDIFAMECGLIPLLVDMRFEGVTVDITKAEQTRDSLIVREQLAQEKINHLAGGAIDIGKKDDLVRVFDKLGLAYGHTDLGNPSITSKILDNLNHPLGDAIRELRKYEKLRGTFIESYILDSHINGKVYGSFHPLRGDEGGTRSGRFSSSQPNLQNIPSRDEELAPLIRGMFTPDAGHAAWRKYDYSQIEYRFLVHFAVGVGAAEARSLYNTEPSTDYHEMALDLVAPEAGWDVSTPVVRKTHRRPIKNINFGLIFGMGVDKLSSDLGLTPKQGRALFAAYHKGVPFAKSTMDACSEEADTQGYITTILGRRSRFDLWEPRKGWGSVALPYDRAILEYGSIRRAHLHKALNRRLQGSAADLLKKAMLDCYRAGVFDETGVPRSTVHDELNFSDPGGKDAAFAEMQHIMETAIPLSIPVKADGDIGPDWGNVEPLA